MTEPTEGLPQDRGATLAIGWTPSAYRDLENAYEYTRFHNEEAARKLAAAIQKALQRLAQHPESGPIAKDLHPVGAYRHVVIAPYRLIYMVAEQQIIVILRLWDGRRDPAALTIKGSTP